MPGIIRKQFSSLFRSLRLQPAAMELVLQDQVMPVAVIHEHCEGAPFLNSQAFDGVVGAGTTLIAFGDSPAFEAGAYQLTILVASNTAVAQHRVLEFRLGSGTALGPFMFQVEYGAPGNTALNMLITIPKIHFGEGAVLFAINQQAQLAADFLSISYVGQPL